MADLERDPELSRAYRGLGAEEPPRALDDAILAASRRRRPLRWAGPVALAAVLVLAVAVTLQVGREKPQDGVVVAKAPPAPVEEPAKRAEATAARQAAPAAKRERAKPEVFTPDPPAVQPAAPVPESRAADRSRLAEQSSRADAAAPMAAMQAPRAPAASLSVPPERELERIAELRRQEKHEEADKALAAFRKRYPDYRLSEEMRTRVERK